MKILIFADGDNKIGWGHVVRMINLAKSLSLKHKIYFLSEKHDSQKKFKEKFQTFNAKNDLDKIEEIKPDLIIIDKLKISKKNLFQLKKICNNILTIDLIGNDFGLVKYGIAILYPKSAFQHHSEKFNFKYTTIHKDFLKYKRRNINRKVKNVLVVQGGADTYCFIPKIIKILKTNKHKYHYHVVLGPSFNCWNKLETICKNNTNFKILKNVKNMGKIMNKMDIAISAAGMTGLELACIGIPTIFITAEKFELETAKLLEKHGFGKNMGFGRDFKKDKLNSVLNRLDIDFNRRQKMNKIGKKIITGNGIQNLVKFVDSL